MKKKMLITASTFPRWADDTEPRFILDYAKAMCEYYDVTVMAPAAPGARTEEEIFGVKIIRYHYFPIHKWETLCYPGAIVPRIKEKKIRALLVPFLFIGLRRALKNKADKFDIVHAQWLIPQGIVQRRINKPYIITAHGGDISQLNTGFIRLEKEKALRKAKAVCVVSEFKKAELEKLFPDVDCQIISMGVDTDFFGARNRQENYFNQADKRVVLFVGRLAGIKGVNYLIDAVSQMGKPTKLVIVGSGPEEDNLKRQAKALDIDIQFMGGKSHKELQTIYPSADVLVVSSIIDKNGAQEGLPTVILEAMASGLPVVATRTGGIPNLVCDHESGLLCEEKSAESIKEALEKLLNDENLRSDMIQGGYKVVEKYDYKGIASRYRDLLESIDLGD